MGAPFVIGALTDHITTGMWIGLATLLLAAGEREGTYRLNFMIIAVSTPIAAAGYALGYVQKIPLVALIVLMTMLALLMGLIAGLGPAFSVGGMQFLLVASIAIGVEGIDWRWPPVMYFAGAILYAALLGVEMIIDPYRPQRKVLEPLLASLTALAQARIEDLSDGGDRTAIARAQSTAAYEQATTRVDEIPIARRGSTKEWTLDSEVVSAAEWVQALLIGEREPATVTSAAVRLEGLSNLITGAQPGNARMTGSRDGRDSLLHSRIDALESALQARAKGQSIGYARVSTAGIGPEAVLAALRLAVCFGIAVGAKAYFPFNHWFWVPLTVCLVMKPDFGSVFSRALQRIPGTVIGVLIATGVVLVAPKGVVFGIVIALLAALVPWMMLRSYALQAVVIAPIVVLLVAAITPGDQGNYSWQRIAATVIGGAIVILFGYLVWPHSRRPWVTKTFGDAMGSISTHLHIAGSGTPEDAAAMTHRQEDLVTARRTALRSLTDMETRLHRALSEPPPANTVAESWLPVVAEAGRLADSVTVYAADRAAGSARANAEQAATVGAAIRDVGQGREHDLIRIGDKSLVPVSDGLARVTAVLSTNRLERDSS